VKYYGLQKQVKLTGYVNDVYIPISLAKVFLVSGVEDLVGIAGLNAASMGVPVLTYQKDPHWDKGRKFFFNSKSSSELAGEIQRLIEDNRYYEIESKRCKEIMRNYFSVTSMTQNYLKVYTQLLKGDL
jgi:glycosyltransferase involved in cell wall biosynthesis